MAAVTDCQVTSPLPQHAQMIAKSVRTTQQQIAPQCAATSVLLSWPSLISPPAAVTILAGDCETGSLHTGVEGSGIKQLNTGKTVFVILDWLSNCVLLEEDHLIAPCVLYTSCIK